MERVYKQVPFGIELAKKIQSGEVEGRIVTKNYLQCEIVAWCGTDFFVKRKACLYSPVWCYPYTKDGHFIDGKNNGGTDYDLVIELKEEEPKHEFKPFDKVLVRDLPTNRWFINLFSHYGRQGNKVTHHCMCGDDWIYCIPYEGNEHLVGTTDNPK